MNVIKNIFIHFCIMLVILGLSIYINEIKYLNITLTFLVFYILFHALFRVEVIDYYINSIGIKLYRRY